MSAKATKKKRAASDEEAVLPSRKSRVSALLATLRTVKPRTSNQQRFITDLRDPKVTINIGAGLAGAGKTYLSLAIALEELRNPDSAYDELIIFKSVKLLEGEDMGFLPGDKNEKLQFIYQSFFMQLERLLAPGMLEKLLDDKVGCVKVLPLGAIRGISISPTTIVIVDEVQNLSIENTHTLLTRFEEGAKLICIGDEKQRDHRNKQDNGLTYLVNHVAGLSSEIAMTRFTEADCVRKKLIKDLQRVFDKYMDDKENPGFLKKVLRG